MGIETVCFSRWVAVTVACGGATLRVVVPLERYGQRWRYRFDDGQELVLDEEQVATSPQAAREMGVWRTVD